MRTLPPVLPLALLLASLAPLPGCHDGSSAGTAGDGVTKTDPRDVATFDAIEVDGAVKLEISSSPATELSLSGDENILPLISTTVTGGKLVIHPTVAINPKLPLVVSVHVPTLRRIDVNGAASLHVKGLRAASFTLASNGVSDAELSGQVGQLEVDLAGAGRVRAAELSAKEALVTVSGAGSVEVNATDKLKAEVSGVGAIRYRGAPSNLEKNVSGLGSVSPLS